VTHGRLVAHDIAPARGEATVHLATGDGFTVEQILSGPMTEPQDYDQDHDEWVVVLAGRASLEVGGVAYELGAGDWWLLPAHTQHRLLRAEPGTSWLAVRSVGRGEHA
jgi:cupin 2 domain-containing protein